VLKLRRGTVVEADPPTGSRQRLLVQLEHARGPGPRPALADLALVGPSEPADEVVVNVEGRDLELGSGGFDVVHANLTRGMRGEGTADAHVMKLNYTSLQHAVVPVEGEELAVPLGRPVGVLALHGQLAPVAWALAQAAGGVRVGFVQTAGGALPGGMSDVVRDLRERALLAGFLTAGPAYGGEGEAITTAGALHHGLVDLEWDAALCGPGPGILGSGSALGHGGMAALDSAHVALALGCPTVVVARMSSGDPRPRHRDLSHHTRTVLELLLAPAVVALPAESAVELPGRHERRTAAVDLDGYRASGLPARTMGRDLDEDPLFFAAALAGGTALGELAA
jgi:hypothetical protein